MFITKNMHNKIVKTKEREIEELQNKIDRQARSQGDLRREIEDEHLENYNNHQKLLAIEKLLKEQDYNSIENLKNRIRTILNKELSNKKWKQLDNSKIHK